MFRVEFGQKGGGYSTEYNGLSQKIFEGCDGSGRYLVKVELAECVLKDFVVVDVLILVLGVKVYLHHQEPRGTLSTFSRFIAEGVKKHASPLTLDIGTMPGWMASTSWQAAAPDAVWQGMKQRAREQPLVLGYTSHTPPFRDRQVSEKELPLWLGLCIRCSGSLS